MKKIIYIFTMIFAFSICDRNVYANDIDEKQIINNIKISMITWEGEKRYIDSFDVDDNGCFALASSDGKQKYVLFYDAEGIFLYGYKFFSTGDIRIRLVEEGLKIYFIRSDVSVLMDSKGNCLECKEYAEMKIPNLYTKKKINNRIYFLKGGSVDWLLGAYSMFVSEDQNEANRTLYKVDDDIRRERIIKLIGVCGFFAIVLFINLKGIYRVYKYSGMKSIS